MAEWFGQDEVASWQLLRVYRIPFAQPNQVTCLSLALQHMLRLAWFVAVLRPIGSSDVLSPLSQLNIHSMHSSQLRASFLIFHMLCRRLPQTSAEQ